MKPYERSPIRDARVNTALDRLHRKAGRQLPGVVAHIAGQALRLLITRKWPGEGDLVYYRDKLIPIDRRQGWLIYLLCRSLKARRAVEFGTSFGVSTLYLASAIRDNGGGTVIGTEFEASKARIARQNFEAAGLTPFIDLREGDAFETLKDCGGPVDFLLVDGWAHTALPILKLMIPQLRSGAVVFCDASGHAPSDKAAYADFMHDPANGFVTAHFPLYGGTEISVKV